MPMNKKTPKVEWDFIASELKGLYIEADKLGKKSPSMTVSDLELGNANHIIETVKAFLAGDAIVDRIQRFEPAGDNPEYREIVLVLRQLIQAMNRYAPGVPIMV